MYSSKVQLCQKQIIFERVEQVRLAGMNNSFRKRGESGLPVSTCTSLFCQWALDLLMYLNAGSRFVPVARAGKPAFSVRAPYLRSIPPFAWPQSWCRGRCRQWSPGTPGTWGRDPLGWTGSWRGSSGTPAPRGSTCSR